MPSYISVESQAYLQWNGARFIHWAEQIGPHTAAVVLLFLTSHKVDSRTIGPVWRC